MTVRLARSVLGGVLLLWGMSAAAQDPPAIDDSEVFDSYFADPTQSFVSEVSQADAADASDAETETPVAVNDFAGTPASDEPAVASAQKDSEHCQTLQESIVVRGESQLRRGTLCRQSDGTWQIADSPSLTESFPDIVEAPLPPPRRSFTPTYAPRCRDVRQTIYIDGRRVTAYGTQCRQSDGTWQLVAPSRSSRPSTVMAAREPRRYENDDFDYPASYGRRVHPLGKRHPNGKW